jgi:FkbM family methyltransferase
MQLDLGDHLQRAMAADCHEPQEDDVIKALLAPGDLIIDVGANIGYNTLKWGREVLPDGRVLAFEPVPPNFAALQKNLELNSTLDVAAHHLALGNVEGSIRLSSDRPGATSGSYSVTNTNAGSFEVPQQRLDDWIGDRELTGLKLIKIDVEGSEPDVLMGARAVITKYKPYLLVEWNRGHLRGQELEHLVRALSTHDGYRWSIVQPSRWIRRGLTVPLSNDPSQWPKLCNFLGTPSSR